MAGFFEKNFVNPDGGVNIAAIAAAFAPAAALAAAFSGVSTTAAITGAVAGLGGGVLLNEPIRNGLEVVWNWIKSLFMDKPDTGGKGSKNTDMGTTQALGLSGAAIAQKFGVPVRSTPPTSEVKPPTAAEARAKVFRQMADDHFQDWHDWASGKKPGENGKYSGTNERVIAEQVKGDSAMAERVRIRYVDTLGKLGANESLPIETISRFVAEEIAAPPVIPKVEPPKSVIEKAGYKAGKFVGKNLPKGINIVGNTAAVGAFGYGAYEGSHNAIESYNKGDTASTIVAGVETTAATGGAMIAAKNILSRAASYGVPSGASSGSGWFGPLGVIVVGADGVYRTFQEDTGWHKTQRGIQTGVNVGLAAGAATMGPIGIVAAPTLYMSNMAMEKAIDTEREWDSAYQYVGKSVGSIQAMLQEGSKQYLTLRTLVTVDDPHSNSLIKGSQHLATATRARLNWEVGDRVLTPEEREAFGKVIDLANPENHPKIRAAIKEKRAELEGIASGDKGFIGFWRRNTTSRSWFVNVLMPYMYLIGGDQNKILDAQGAQHELARLNAAEQELNDLEKTMRKSGPTNQTEPLKPTNTPDLTRNDPKNKDRSSTPPLS